VVALKFNPMNDLHHLTLAFLFSAMKPKWYQRFFRQIFSLFDFVSEGIQNSTLDLFPAMHNCGAKDKIPVLHRWFSLCCNMS